MKCTTHQINRFFPRESIAKLVYSIKFLEGRHMVVGFTTTCAEKHSLNSDGQQFHQQQKQSPLTSKH
jgi:hypothetical protein